jgi:hypothetical protein
MEWYWILLVGVFALPEEIALKAGLHKGDVRIPAGYQGSRDYMASLEVTHQLHCVVSLLILRSSISCPVEEGKKNYYNGKEIPFSAAKSPARYPASNKLTPIELSPQGRLVQLPTLQRQRRRIPRPPTRPRNASIPLPRNPTAIDNVSRRPGHSRLQICAWSRTEALPGFQYAA